MPQAGFFKLSLGPLLGELISNVGLGMVSGHLVHVSGQFPLVWFRAFKVFGKIRIF